MSAATVMAATLIEATTGPALAIIGLLYATFRASTACKKR
jgi:hypothetical protein